MSAKWLSNEADEIVDTLQRTRELEAESPTAAFALELEAAERGSAFAMESVGWRYWTGTGVAIDRENAAKFYHRAVEGGNGRAAIAYARILFELSQQHEWEAPLLRAIEDEFLPASFWLAWLRYGQSQHSARIRREVLPLIEFAAKGGHPMAAFIIRRWMFRGYLGVSKIPYGVASVLRWTFSSNAGAKGKPRT